MIPWDTVLLSSNYHCKSIFLLTYLNIKVLEKYLKNTYLEVSFLNVVSLCWALTQCLILSGIESWKQSIDHLACNKNSLAGGTLTPPTFISVKSQISATSSNPS